jgi:hypothetical protein
MCDPICPKCKDEVLPWKMEGYIPVIYQDKFKDSQGKFTNPNNLDDSEYMLWMCRECFHVSVNTGQLDGCLVIPKRNEKEYPLIGRRI